MCSKAWLADAVQWLPGESEHDWASKGRDLMSILSDSRILAVRELGDIVIEPFDRECLGSNSYDVHLGPILKTYAYRMNTLTGSRLPIDPKIDNPTNEWVIPEKGLRLDPNRLYLGATVEYTETRRHVPNIDGRSSVGRLGISVHVTAGRGDVGFCGHFTLEITVVEPTIVYPGMPIGQLTYHEVEGEILRPYNTKPNANYNNRDPKPQPSKMHLTMARAASLRAFRAGHAQPLGTKLGDMCSHSFVGDTCLLCGTVR